MLVFAKLNGVDFSSPETQKVKPPYLFTVRLNVLRRTFKRMEPIKRPSVAKDNSDVLNYSPFADVPPRIEQELGLLIGSLVS